MEEKTKQKKKLSKQQLRTIIVASVSAAIAIALIITNFFVPVKYLFSYMVIRNKGAAEGVMRVRFVDVGYGDCTIVELPDGKNMLIDAGDGTGSNEGRILKYLNKCDINTIDYLVCTSVNPEHCGGLVEILQYKTVSAVFIPYCNNNYITDEYLRFILKLNPYGAIRNYCEIGEKVENAEYGYSFEFLSPSYHGDPMGEYEELKNNPSSETVRNNASAVLWLSYGGTNFLFTSDAGSQSLTNICNSYNTGDYPVNIEDCTVAQVANHGSDSSRCSEFYSLINPEIAVISVGKNAKNCPSVDVISDVSDAEILRTDEKGTITIEVTKDGHKVV